MHFSLLNVFSLKLIFLFVASDLLTDGNATPSDQRLAAWPTGDAVGREDHSPGRPMRPLPDALLAIRHPRLDASLSRRLRPRPQLDSSSARLRRGSHSSAHSANLWSGATSGHSLAAVFPGVLRTRVANSRLGEHQGM